MKYYIIAGEASGDLHGSNLMKGIYAEDPQAEIRFWGGDAMQSVSRQPDGLVRHYKEGAVMGFVDTLFNLRLSTILLILAAGTAGFLLYGLRRKEDAK